MKALLAFEPGPKAVPRAGDLWTVEGRVPRALAFRVTASGFAPATMVIGGDGDVRELRVTGDAAAELAGVPLPTETVARLTGTPWTRIRLTRIGGTVTITPPSENLVYAG